MGSFRFGRSIKIAPGVKLNLNKKSTSLTFGTKGFHHTVSSNGKRTTSAGIPGTGLSYVDVQSPKKNKDNYAESHISDAYTVYESPEQIENQISKQEMPLLMRTWFQLLMLLTLTPVGIFSVWYYREWKTPIKVLLSIVFILYFTFVGAFWG